MTVSQSEAFKILRKEKKISQTELSKLSGINRNYISDFENGRNSPTDTTVRKLLVPLGIKYVDFLIDYCGYKRIKDNEEVEEQALLNSKNENDSLQQFFSTFVDISEIKGFELDGNPLSNEEQTALFSLITLIKTNKEKEEKLFVQLQEHTNKDKTDKP